MRKIVFSFDDGLLDFYENVFPILKKYKIGATLNVATGFCDKTYKNNFKYCNIKQLKEMSDCGIELAIHSDSHSDFTSVDDLNTCYSKLSNWVGKEKIKGVVIPYNIKPSDDIFDWMSENGLIYLRGDNYSNFRFYHNILHKIGLVKKSKVLVKQNSRIYKKNKVRLVYCFPIWYERNLDYYKKMIDLIPKNGQLTLMFHSVLPSDEECRRCLYPQGSWTINKFLSLLEYIMQKNISVVCEKDLF